MVAAEEGLFNDVKLSFQIHTAKLASHKFHDLGDAFEGSSKEFFLSQLEFGKCRSFAIQNDSGGEFAKASFWPHLCEELDLLRPLFYAVRM